ncbi:hypothetical protein [Hymenobacter cheonanensis]|uniref:hypothetical protein n=1 Tax=Hymenobacter sp. CA2-7 TaxID=3063993 RepID=UPI0027133E7D|nr:hypothetical protein [Hymenobacter sp. CA2-7]MDO7888243.1 hypothetical protein [Hymenobacter sp. CA2-7]
MSQATTKSWVRACYWLVVAASLLLLASQVGHAQPSRARQAQAATCTLEFLRAHQTVRETQGNNAGPGVRALVLAGGGEYTATYHPEYCGFSQAAANRSCGLPIPRNGMQGAAKSWAPLTGPDAGRTLFHRAAGRGSIDSIRVGLKACFDYGRGLHHVAAVDELGRPVRAGRAPRSVWTWAGNEGKGTNAGMHRTLYPIGAIDALSNWNY